MAKAGLTHGGFYSHFGSREELIAAAITQTFADVPPQLCKASGGDTAPDTLLAYFDWYLSASHRDQVEAGCPLPSLCSDMPRLDAVSRTAFSSGLAAVTAKVAAKLTGLGAAMPDALAASLLAEAVGALSLARAVHEPEQSELILLRSRESIAGRIAVAIRPECPATT